MTKLSSFFLDESGATAIEYGLVAAAMGIGLIVAFIAFGGSLGALFGDVNDKAGSAMNNAQG